VISQAKTEEGKVLFARFQKIVSGENPQASRESGKVIVERIFGTDKNHGAVFLHGFSIAIAGQT
jgi:hypothetical protein